MKTTDGRMVKSDESAYRSNIERKEEDKETEREIEQNEN